MNKIVFPAILVATIMVAGAFAFVPVEQASTVHLSGEVVSGSITASGTSDVNIAINTGSANSIVIGVAADPDTIALNGDTTIVGDTTIGSATADTFNWATAGGDTFNIGTGTGTDTVNIATGNTVDTVNIGNGSDVDTINIGIGGGVDVITIGSGTSKIGFFGVTPLVQADIEVNITSAGGTTPDDTLVLILDTSIIDRAGLINDNFDELVEDLNEVKTALFNLGLTK